MSIRRHLLAILKFWHKYEDLNLKIAFFLLSLQIIHFYWLTTDVVLQRIYGSSFFVFPPQLLFIFIVVDYLEIPALIFGSAYYALEFFKNFGGKNFLFLVFLLLQIYHVFWLTDEIVYTIFFGTTFLAIPVFAAWFAIFVDYLEIPVIADLLRRLIRKG